MKIVICGAGHVGQSLIHYLNTDYEIVVIDLLSSLLEKIQSKYDVQTICGGASDPRILEKADLKPGTALVAVTGSDEVNLATCQMAQGFESTLLKVIRLENDHYFQEPYLGYLKTQCHVDLVFSPTRNAKRSVMKSFETPYAFDSYPLGKGKLILIGVQIHSASPFLNKSVRYVCEHLSYLSFKIIRIIRGYAVLPPEKKCKILLNDAVYFIGSFEEKDTLMASFGYGSENKSPVILIGASAVNCAVIAALKPSGRPITLIEEDSSKIMAIATQNPKVLFLNGSPFNPEILMEAQIQNTAYTVACTEDDTANILFALMAHSYGVPHCISLVRSIGYLSPLFAMGIEKIVHPSQLIVAELLQRLTKEYVSVFYPLEGGQSGMVIETVAQKGAKAIGMHTKDIHTEDLAFVASMQPNGEISWRHGIIETGSTLIFSVMVSGYQHFQRLFDPSFRRNR